MTAVTGTFVCPAGHVLETVYRLRAGCKACRAEETMADATRLLVEAVPSLGPAGAAELVASAGGSPLGRNQLHAWLGEDGDVLRSGRSDCPRSGARLLAELSGRGFDVALPRCLDCGMARPLPDRVDGGRVCARCYQRRNVEECGSCGRVKPVAARDAEGRALCSRCRNSDPATWRPCGRCGQVAQTIAFEDGVAVGSCCYVAPQLRCTVCGIRKGAREWRTRRPVCTVCAEVDRTSCETCGLDAPTPQNGAPAACARCRTGAQSPCSACGLLTLGRSQQGEARCADCYERPVGPCGRCERIRPVVRLAVDGDPDLCGVCWKGPVMVCESCGRTAPCRGERKGEMRCTRCRPVTPQPCAHCGEARKPMAHWHEGPVCAGCYYLALAAKADCPSCGDHRRLRRYPGFDEAVCADCAGQPATHVCERCGIEDCLYERGVCPRCVAHRRLEALLGDEAQRATNGLGPLFDALAGSPAPKAVLDWLIKTPRAADALARMGRGEVAVSYETIDELEPALGVHTARHLENLLASTATLPPRDPVLAATERWCTRLLASIDHDEHAKLLRTWVRWQVLRPLRDKANQRPLLDSTGYSARRRLQNVADFCAFVAGRGRSLSTCGQADVDAWTAGQPPSRVRSLPGFTTWAIARRAMPRLDVPIGRSGLTAPSMATDDRCKVVRHLLHGSEVAPAMRVAGVLVALYAQPLFKVSRLRLDDLEVAPDRVVVRFGRSAINLPEPLAGHARALIVSREPAPRKANLPVDPGWLFPGKVPGRPITPAGLSRQLALHGVRAGNHRLTALYEFAGEMPAPLLAEILGVNRNTAEAWSRLANRSWAEYPAVRTEHANA